jgi:multiple sugar transport system ATP-binding protein
MSLADRIVIMHEGVLQQVGSPSEVYARPANMFVAQFVGSPVMNMAQATVSEAGGQASVQIGGAVAGFDFPAALAGRLSEARAENGNLTLGVRPEGVLVSREAREGFMPVEAHIIEPLGSHDIVDLKVGDQMLRARTKSGFVARPGEAVFARVDPVQAHFFNTATGASLGIRL